MNNIQISKKIIGNETQSVVSSLVIAEGVKNTHKVIVNLIRSNLKDLEEFGKVHFEKSPSINSKTNQNLTVAFLNEQQCTSLCENHAIKTLYKEKYGKEWQE